MTDELKQAVRASNAMAKNKQDPMRQAKAIKGLDIALGIASASISGHRENHEVHGNNPEVTSESNPVQINLPKPEQNMNQIVLDLETYTLSYKFDVLDDETIPWDFLSDLKSKDLLAVINTESRLYQTSTDQEFIGILALSEAVVGFLIRDLGHSYAKAREIRDNWLFDALKSRVKVKS